MDAAPSSTLPAASNDNTVEKSIISISQVDYINLSSLVTKHWRVMVNNDPRCREVYKKSLMVSIRRPPNLKDKLVRAKLPPARNNTRPRRRERYRRMSPTLPICDEELSDSRVRTPSPAPSENLNLNTDQQKVSYLYWLCYCTDQDVGCKNLVFQICCKT